MFSRLKELWYIITNYRKLEASFRAQNQAILRLENIVRESTSLNFDIHYRGASYVILVGSLNGRDFVQSYALHGDLRDIHAQMREMQRYGHIGRVDTPPEFRGAWESFRWK